MYINLDVIQESFCGPTNRDFFYRPNHHQIIDGAPDFNRGSAVSTIDEGIRNLTDFIRDQYNDFNNFKMQTNPVYPNISGIVDTNYTNPGSDVYEIQAFKKDSLTTDISFDYSIPPNLQKAAIFGAGFSNQDSSNFGSFSKSEQSDLLGIMEFKEGFRKELNKEENTQGSSKSVPFTNYKNFGSFDMTLDDKKNLLDGLQTANNPLYEYMKNHINIIEPYQLAHESGKSNFNSVYMSPQVMYSALLKDSDVPQGEKGITNQVQSLTSITLADFQTALKTEGSESDSVDGAPPPFIPSKLIQTLANSGYQKEENLTSVEEMEDEAVANIKSNAEDKAKGFRFFTYEKNRHDNLQHNLPVFQMSGNLQQMFEHLHMTNQLKGNRNPHYGIPGMLKVSITLHGISGILPGNKFKIDYIPQSLRDTSYFLITGVSQDLTDTGWTTTIDAILRRDPRKVNITPLTYDLKVSNVYDDDAVEPVVERTRIPVPSDEEDILDNEPLETLDVTDFFPESTPYEVAFDTDHQFKRPTAPVPPGTIADSSQTAYYKVVVDPMNPGASTFGFGQTDVLTWDEYESIIDYYSNLESYKDFVSIDENGNELDARQQVEAWLDERYETFTFFDFNVGSTIGASGAVGGQSGAEQNDYDSFSGPMTIYVKKMDPNNPGQGTMNKLMELIAKLKEFQENENQRRTDFADTSLYPEDEGGRPRESIQLEPERQYLDDVLKLFLSKDRNIMNLIHPSVVQTPPPPPPEVKDENNEEGVVVEETKDGKVDDTKVDEVINETAAGENAEAAQEVIPRKVETPIGTIKLRRSFRLEYLAARARIGPLGVFYWEPGAYLQAKDNSGAVIELSTERRKVEYAKWAKSDAGKSTPKPGWYYTAMVGSGLPGGSGQSVFANGATTTGFINNNVMLFGADPDRSSSRRSAGRGGGYASAFEAVSVGIGGPGRNKQFRVPMADVDGKGMGKLVPTGRQRLDCTNWDGRPRKLKASVNEMMRKCNQVSTSNRQMSENFFSTTYDQLVFDTWKIFEKSPYYPWPTDLAVYENPGQTPFYQESIDAALLMGNVITRADFAAKNKLAKEI